VGGAGHNGTKCERKPAKCQAFPPNKFSRHAKHPGQAFDARARADRAAQLRAHLGSDLPAALQAMEATFPHPLTLADPLIAPSPVPSKGGGVAMREAAVAL
jgi:hypothetical protein